MSHMASNPSSNKIPIGFSSEDQTHGQLNSINTEFLIIKAVSRGNGRELHYLEVNIYFIEIIYRLEKMDIMREASLSVKVEE